MRNILWTAPQLGLVLTVGVACAPAAPEGSDKSTSSSVSMLEDMVYGHHTTFESTEELAIEGGIDLESDRSADWPRSGTATVEYAGSVVGTEFVVDRTDYERTSRTWSVNLVLNPMIAAGNTTTGEMSGKWDYWIEGDEAEGNTMGWVEISLTGNLVSPSYPGGAVTEVYAVVNDDGQIYEAEIVHGDDTQVIAP